MGIGEIFAINLKRLREAKGLTQAQLAESAGMSVTAVAHFETGRRWPKPESIEALSMGLGVEEAALFAAPTRAHAMSPEAIQGLLLLAVARLDDPKALELVGEILDVRIPHWRDGRFENVRLDSKKVRSNSDD